MMPWTDGGAPVASDVREVGVAIPDALAFHFLEAVRPEFVRPTREIIPAHLIEDDHHHEFRFPRGVDFRTGPGRCAQQIDDRESGERQGWQQN